MRKYSRRLLDSTKRRRKRKETLRLQDTLEFLELRRGWF
jgi:hypothetical protein